MKYNPKHYAMSLYEALIGKDEISIKKTLDNFVGILKKNKDLSLVGKIFKEFEKYSFEKQGILSGEIFFARQTEKDIKTMIKNKLIGRQIGGKKIKEINFKEQINKDLIGGFKLKLGEILIDASIKGTLDRLCKNLKNSVNK